MAPWHLSNARLIAAAPDLLEACNQALELQSECSSEGSDDVPPEQCLHCVLCAAIAKANGNEPSQARGPYRLTSCDAANGTHLYADVALSPAGIIRAFGPGGEGDGFKVSRQWVFRKGTLVFTLYDWKSTSLYDSRLRSPEDLWTSTEPFTLHVGSKHSATGEDVDDFVKYLKRQVSVKDSWDDAPASCTQCGAPHTRTKPWNGEPEDLCDGCENARRAEINRVYEHHERHPDECCCATFLGRECCMAPIHGDLYRALCIEHGERFTTDFRAKDREEAMALGREHASGWGGECIRVWKVRRKPTRRAA